MKRGCYSIYQLYGKHGDCRVLIKSYPTSGQCIHYLRLLQLIHPEAKYSTVYEHKDNGLQASDSDPQQKLPF